MRNLRVSGSRPGIGVAAPLVAHIEDVVIAGTVQAAMGAFGGARLSAHTLVVRDTQSRSSMFGAGLEMADGAQVELSRALFERNRTLGLNVAEAGTLLRLTDVAGRVAHELLA